MPKAYAAMSSAGMRSFYIDFAGVSLKRPERGSGAPHSSHPSQGPAFVAVLLVAVTR